jgi:hypothetical protein
MLQQQLAGSKLALEKLKRESALHESGEYVKDEVTSSSLPMDNGTVEMSHNAGPGRKSTGSDLPPKYVPELARLIKDHGNMGTEKMAATFASYHPGVSKRQTQRKIDELAIKERDGRKVVWILKNEYSHMLDSEKYPDVKEEGGGGGGDATTQQQHSSEKQEDNMAGNDSSESGRKRKMVVLKKDKNAPKKPNSAYRFFIEDEKSKLSGTMKFPEILSQATEKWKTMADEDKQVYNDLAADDMDRYKTEIKAYRKGLESGDSDHGSSSAPKKMKISTPAYSGPPNNDPAEGWHRMVVSKKDPNGPGGMRKDVYYFSPAPLLKRFKTKSKVNEYLTQNTSKLRIASFNFNANTVVRREAAFVDVHVWSWLIYIYIYIYILYCCVFGPLCRLGMLWKYVFAFLCQDRSKHKSPRASFGSSPVANVKSGRFPCALHLWPQLLSFSLTNVPFLCTFILPPPPRGVLFCARRKEGTIRPHL